MTCNAKGALNATYQWTLNGEAVAESSVLSITTVTSLGFVTSSVLRITDVEAASHKGNFTCIATSRDEVETSSVLLVVSPEGILSVTPSSVDIFGDLGDNITFIGETDAGPGSEYVWLFDPTYSLCISVSDCSNAALNLFNTLDNNSVLSNTLMLPLTNVSGLKDGGVYALIVINNAGYEVVIRRLYFLPRFLKQPEDIIAEVNQSVSTNVVIDGTPYPTIEWQKLVEGEFIAVPGENQTILQFTSIGYTEAGVYKCLLSVVINKTEYMAESREFVVSVSLADTATLEGTDGLVSQGGELVIICNAKGGPNNTYNWFLDGEEIMTTDVLNVTTIVDHTESSSILKISSVDAAAHKGNYTCSVSNRAGQDSTSIIVTVSPVGIVSTTPINSTVSHGNNLTLHCRTDAGPGTHFAWLYNVTSNVYCNTSSCYSSETNSDLSESILSRENELTVNNITGFAHGGMYTCIAFNKAGMDKSESIINVLPEFLKHPLSINATSVSETYILTCSANGYPMPKIQWQKMNNSSSGIFVDIEGETESSLEISTSNPWSSGTYRCQADNTIDSILNIIYSDPAVVSIPLDGTVSITPQGIDLDYGSSLTLNCSAAGGPNNIFEWSFNGTILTLADTDRVNISNDEPFYSLLSIDHVSAPLHGGTFVCETRNLISRDANATAVFIKPRFLEHPKPSTKTTVNNTLQLNCIAESYPHPKYSWKRSNDSSIVLTGSSTLLFDPVDYDDMGYYTCMVESYSTVIESNIAVVYVSPLGSIKTSPDVFASVGDTAELVCSAKGGPDNQFEWKHLLSNQTLSSGPNLTISSITVYKGGDYQCIALNAAGFDKGTTSVNVKPEIIQPSQLQNITISKGEVIVLNCSADGIPTPTISWEHNKELLKETDRISNLTIIAENHTIFSTLTILDSVLTDSGSYVCILGSLSQFSLSSSNPVTVLVQDVPDTPNTISTSNVSSRGLFLEWERPDSRNAPILGYYVIFEHPSFLNGTLIVLKTDGAKESMIVENLHPGTVYTFRVIAYNEEGNSSNQTTGYQETTLEEKPDGPPTHLMGLAISSTEIFLKWSPPPEINRLGNIISYDIIYEGMDMNGTVVDPSSIVSASDTQTTLKDLQEHTLYDVSVRAVNSAGFGPEYDPSITILTNESLPGPVSPPRVLNIVNKTSIAIIWNEPSDPNGVIIGYLIKYSALDWVDRPYADNGRRRRRKAVSEGLQECFNYLERNDTEKIIEWQSTEAIISELIPFSMYEVSVAAVTIIGPGNFSEPTIVSIQQSDPGEIVNLRGVAKNSTAIVLGWNGPPCPYGVIMGYNVFYTTINYTRPVEDIPDNNFTMKTFYSRERDLVFDLTDGIRLGQDYFIHIKAFSNYSIAGRVIQSIEVTVEEQLTLPFISALTTPSSTGDSSIGLTLPDLDDIIVFTSSNLLSNLTFIGIVVVKATPGKEFNPETDNFDLTYPNLEPYNEQKDNQTYYICAAWNSKLHYPTTFRIGDDTTTTAERHGVEETYANTPLESSTEYCYFILTHSLFLGNEEEEVIRYHFINCSTTDVERSPVGVVAWVIIIPILIVLLVCCLCCIFIILCYCCRRNKNKELRADDYMELQDKPVTQERKPSNAIAIINFPLYVKRMHENQDYPFSKEFENIEPKHSPTYNASLSNRDKNRFSSLPAYDHSRVILEQNPSDNDYINANFVHGYEDLGDFIATQGPLKNTIGDFWWMIWEKRIPVIVMLTNLQEKGRVKSHCYWPSEEKPEQVYDAITVVMESEAIMTHQTIRTFKISCNSRPEVRRVTQYHFTSWPDHGVPKSTRALLELVEYVRSMYKPDLGPVLVHCGTGVGRTGAFIALYVMLARLTRETTVDIYNYVQYMRKQRISMVSNETEYIFVHDALVDALRAGMIRGYILGLNEDTPVKVAENS